MDLRKSLLTALMMPALLGISSGAYAWGDKQDRDIDVPNYMFCSLVSSGASDFAQGLVVNNWDNSASAVYLVTDKNIDTHALQVSHDKLFQVRFPEPLGGSFVGHFTQGEMIHYSKQDDLVNRTFTFYDEREHLDGLERTYDVTLTQLRLNDRTWYGRDDFEWEQSIVINEKAFSDTGNLVQNHIYDVSPLPVDIAHCVNLEKNNNLFTVDQKSAHETIHSVFIR